MTNLINVWETEKGNQAVSAKELHSYLEVGRDFSTWIKNRIEKYDFIENKDFCKLYFNSISGERITYPNLGVGENKGFVRIEYVLTLNMAKELAMVENNEKGKEARRYFIQCEEQFRAQKNVIPVDKQIELEKYRAFTSLATLVVNAPSDKVKELLYSSFLQLDHGYNAAPVERKTYSATEICGLIKSRYGVDISINMLGRLTTKYDLKRSEWGVFSSYKTKRNKDVSIFRYYEEVVEKLKDIITKYEKRININF